MKKLLWFKTYIIAVILIGAVFLGFNFLAQAQNADQILNLNFCSKTENVSITPRVIDCPSGQHLEGSVCVDSNPVTGDLKWLGNVFNGIWTSALALEENQPPKVIITAPANNAKYIYPIAFDIRAEANDDDGFVTNVNFYSLLKLKDNNGKLTGELGPLILLGSAASATSTYTIHWQYMAIGEYKIRARATDNMGAIYWTNENEDKDVSIVPNIPPTVSITSLTSPDTINRNIIINDPEIGKSSDNPILLHGPTDLTFGLQANDTDGTIYSVQAFWTQLPKKRKNEICKLGDNSSNNFTNDSNCTWHTIPALESPAGYVYSLFVRATDNNGAFTDTSLIYIKVTNEPPIVNITNLIVTGADQETILYDYQKNIETCSSCTADCGVCAATPECGDNKCNGTETCTSCPADCGSICAATAVCGDKICNGNGLLNATMPIGGNIKIIALIEDDIAVNNIKFFKNADLITETCSSCPGDCGDCAVAPSCGDSICSGTETCSSCPADCGGTCATTPVCDDHICNGGKDLINEDFVRHDTPPSPPNYAEYWWQNVPEGKYGLNLHVTDNGGLFADSPRLDLAAIYETCNNGMDDNKNGKIDTVVEDGCLPINFNFAGEQHAFYWINTKPQKEEDWKLIAKAGDNNLGFIQGSKNFDYTFLSGAYDMRVQYNFDTPLTSLPYTNFNLSLTPSEDQSIIKITNVSATGDNLYGGTHENKCTHQLAACGIDSSCSISCKLVTSRCTGVATSCGGESANTNPGTAYISLYVHSPNEKIIVITSPVDNTTYQWYQTTFILQAYASSPNTIKKVIFYGRVAGQTTATKIQEDNTSLYAINVNAATWSSGTYELIATACENDTCTQSFTSAPVKIILQ